MTARNQAEKVLYKLEELNDQIRELDPSDPAFGEIQRQITALNAMFEKVDQLEFMQKVEDGEK